MIKANLDFYTNYLLNSFGAAWATGLTAIVYGDVSHDQITRGLSAQAYIYLDLWQQVKLGVSSIKHHDGVLILSARSTHQVADLADRTTGKVVATSLGGADF